jgi:hypothetical protein
MSETEYAAAMTAVVTELKPLLKGHGFRKRRHTFNREPEDGLVQVVSFQMGAHMVGDPVEVPGLRENLYGRFTVNLGIFLRDVHERLAEFEVPAFVSESHCEISMRLGELPTGSERWWNLEQDPRELAADVGDELREHGMPWLDALSSRASILQAWHREGDAIGFAPRGRLIVALMHWLRGEHQLAERLVRDYLEGSHPPGHAEYVQEVLDRNGMRKA